MVETSLTGVASVQTMPVTGDRVKIMGNSLISVVAPDMRRSFGFPETRAGLSSRHVADAVAAVSTIADLLGECGAGILALFDRNGVHGSRAFGLTEAGREKLYAFAGVAMPPWNGPAGAAASIGLSSDA